MNVPLICIKYNSMFNKDKKTERFNSVGKNK